MYSSLVALLLACLTVVLHKPQPALAIIAFDECRTLMAIVKKSQGMRDHRDLLDVALGIWDT